MTDTPTPDARPVLQTEGWTLKVFTAELFQTVEWLIVISAVRWAGIKTENVYLNAVAWVLLFLLAAHLMRTLLAIVPARWVTEDHGQPIRARLTNALIALAAIFMAAGMAGMVSDVVDALVEANAAPPENPPETPEKSVNVTGGQSPIGH